MKIHIITEKVLPIYHKIIIIKNLINNFLFLIFSNFYLVKKLFFNNFGNLQIL